MYSLINTISTYPQVKLLCCVNGVIFNCLRLVSLWISLWITNKEWFDLIVLLLMFLTVVSVIGVVVGITLKKKLTLQKSLLIVTVSVMLAGVSGVLLLVQSNAVSKQSDNAVEIANFLTKDMDNAIDNYSVTIDLDSPKLEKLDKPVDLKDDTLREAKRMEFLDNLASAKQGVNEDAKQFIVPAVGTAFALVLGLMYSLSILSPTKKKNKSKNKQ